MAIGKVASYLKNVGKSVSYSLLDVTFKDNAESISDFVETNEDLFKEIYSATKNYKQTLKTAERNIKASKLYTAGAEGWKAAKEDIRTGNFYNKKREQEMNMRSAGDEFSDMFTGDDFTDFDMDMEPSSEPASVNDAFSSAMEDATNASCSIMAKSTDYLASTSRANTKAIMSNNAQLANALAASINGGLGQIHNEIAKFTQIAPGLVTHMENSKTYYETTTKIFQENNAILKELVEMQRNLYKDEYNNSRDKGSAYSNIIGSTGTPDLKEYAKNIAKNAKMLLGPEAEMLFGDTMGKGSNLLLTMIGSPLKVIPNMLAKTLVPVAVTKVLKSFDESISAVFSNMIAQFNYRANHDNYDDDEHPLSGVFKVISKLLGADVRKKESIDPGQYKKGPTPFDGITRQSIIEVIPGHLRRIEAALTGRPERLYNNGRWTNISQVEKEYKNIKSNAIASGSWEMMDSMKSMFDEAREKDTRKYEELVKSMEVMFTKIYNDGGAFRPNDKDFAEENYYDYGFSSESEFRAVINAMNTNKSSMKRMAGDMMSSRERAAAQLRRIEQESSSPIRELFSGAYDDKLVNGEYDPKAKNGYMSKAKDSKGHDSFYYLQNILGELTYMRMYGMSGGKRKGGKPPYISNMTSLIPESDELIKEREKDARTAEELTNRLRAQSIKYPGGMAANYVETASEAEKARLKIQDYNENYRSRTPISKMIDKARDKHGFNPKEPLLDQLLQASSLGQKWKIIQSGIGELTKKPADFLIGIMNKADERLYDLMFGNINAKNKNGVPIRGMIELMVTKVEESFDKLNYWIDDHVLTPIKKKLGVESFGDLFKQMADKLGLTEKWDKYGRPIIKATRNKLGDAYRYARGAVGDVYSGTKNFISDNIIQDPNHVAAMANAKGYGYDRHTAVGRNFINTDQARLEQLADLEDLNDMGTMANGGVVPRSGAYVLSKGEMVIPSYKNKAHLAKQKRNERNIKKAYGRGILGNYAEGTVGKNIKDGKEYVDAIFGKGKGNKVGGTLGEIWNTAKSDVTDTASSGLAGGIIGTGVSLLTGLAGGPILGAAIGVGTSLIKRSDKLQAMLFGEMGADGERQDGGVISATLQKTLKKYVPDIAKGGITGALAGLITPFGPVGGLIIGSAAGFMKNNDSFQTWLYGAKDDEGDRDGGLISKKFRDGVKKALPRMGIGAAAGALLGPGGFLLNAALGAGAGMLTTTDTFKTLMLGEEDADGERSGGILGAINEGLVVPLKNKVSEFGESLLSFAKDDIFSPLKDFVEPLAQSIKNMFIDIGEGIKDTLNDMFEKTIGMPLADLVREKFIKPMAGFLGKAFNLIVNPAKFLISAPAKLLGGIGNKMRASQIRRGHATNMTAKDRLNFRSTHNMLGGKLDQTLAMDGMLDNMDNNTLSQIYEASGEYIKGKDFAREKLTSARKAAGKSVSDFLNKNVRENGVKLYDIFGQKNVKRLDTAISQADAGTAMDIIDRSKLTANEKSTLSDIARKNIDAIAKKAADKDNATHTKEELMAQIEALTGKKMRGNKDFRYLYENVKTEMKAKNKEDIVPGDAAVEQGLAIVSAIKESNSLLRHIAKLDPTEDDKKILGIIPKETSNAAQNRKQQAKAEGIDITKMNSNIDSLEAGLKSFTGTGKLSTGVSTYQTPGGHTITYMNGVPQDDKESSAGLQEIELNDKREAAMAEDIKKTSEHTGGLFSHLFGKDSTKKEDDESFFGKLKGGLSKVLKVLGIGGAIAVGGAAVGYGSEGVKTVLWPMLRDKFFPKIAAMVAGTKDPDTGNLNGGLRGLLIGNKMSNGEYEGGILAPIRPTITKIANSVETFFGFMMDPGEKGFRHWLTGVALPGAAKMLIRGWGLAGENIIVPMFSLLTQSLPSIAKGILLGLKEMLLGFIPGNKVKATTRGIDLSADAGIIKAMNDYSISKSGTSNEFSDTLDFAKRTSVSAATSTHTIDIGKDIANAMKDQNNSETGFLGSKNRTNELVYDSEGNNITDYERKNVQDNFASHIAKTAGRGFVGGVAGNKVPKIFSMLSNLKPNFKHGVVRNTANAAKAGVKYGSDIVTGATKAGQWFGKEGVKRAAGKSSVVGYDLIKHAVDDDDMISVLMAAQSGLGNTLMDYADNPKGFLGSAVANNVKTAVKNSDGIIRKIVSGIQALISGFATTKVGTALFSFLGKAVTPAKFAKQLSSGLDDFVVKLGEKAMSKMSTNALKGIAGAVAGLSPLAIGLAVVDFTNGCRNAYTVYGVANGGVGPDGKFTDEPDYKLNILQTGGAGLLNVLANRFLFGFIPVDTIVDVALETLLPIFGINFPEMMAARENAGNIMDLWNKEHPKTTFDNLQDFNLRNDLLHNAWGAVKDTVGGAVGNISNAVTDWWEGDYEAGGTGRTGGAKDKIVSGFHNITTNAKAGLDAMWNGAKNIGSAVQGFLFGKEETAADGTVTKSTGFFGDPRGTMIKAQTAIDAKLGAMLGMVAEDGKPMSLSEGVAHNWNNFTAKAASGFDTFVNNAKSLWSDAGDAMTKMKEYLVKGMDKLNENIGALFGFKDKDGNPISLTEGINQKFTSVVDSVGGWFQGVSDSVNNFFGIKKKPASGSGRGYGRDYEHVYQRDPRIAGMRYGSGSTIGQAGCGPVAATNLINGLEGYGLDVKTAANYARAGGYTGPDGGTNINYFGDVLNKYGYPNTQTNNPNQVYNSLKQGKQAVLLGKDNLGPNGPYSNRAHFITAKGLDRFGNVIVEDPDRAQSQITYKASDVLSNMHSSVIASPKRNRRGMSGGGRSFTTTSRVSNFIYGFGPANVSDLARKAYNITKEFEGNYNSVNKNDNGGVSVGRIQWNRGRAKDVLARICSALGEQKARNLAGDAMYNDIMGSASWEHRTVSESEANSLKKILDTPEGHTIQDNLALENNQSYIDYAIKLGLKDEKAIVYFADLDNQGGNGGASRVAKAASLMAGSMAKVTLDTIHRAALADRVFSKYAARRSKCYEVCKHLEGVSTDISLGSNTSGGSGTAGATGLMSAISSLGISMVKKMFGADAYEALFGSSETANGAEVSGLSADQQSNVVAYMDSINGKVKYSLGSVQDPDRGVASCASTVGWAYKKAIGGTFATNPMSAGAYTQSLKGGGDSRFTTIFKSGINPDGSGTGSIDESKLMPGDLLYYRRKEYAPQNPYNVGHVEMYAGTGERIGHGGPDKGPKRRSLTNDASNIIMARRYNGFDSNTNPLIENYNVAASEDGNIKHNSYEGYKSGKGRSNSGFGGNNDVSNLNAVRTSSSGNSYGTSISRNSLYNTNGSAGGMSYTEFLKTIIEVLLTIATNSEALGKILALLSDKFGMNMNADEVRKAATSSSGAKAKLSKLLSETGKSPTGYGSLFQDKGTEYIINSMTALARE